MIVLMHKIKMGHYFLIVTNMKKCYILVCGCVLILSICVVCRFIAEDNTGANSSYTVAVKLCDCNQHGDCLFNRTLEKYYDGNNETYFQVVMCQCDPYKYEGMSII